MGKLISLPVFECVHKQKQKICHSATPVNQNEEGSSVSYCKNSPVLAEAKVALRLFQ